MKTRSLWALAALALTVSACTKGPAEKAYLSDCTQVLPKKVCSCSYDMLEERHGARAINEMFEAKKFSDQFKSHVNESLMYCNDLYR